MSRLNKTQNYAILWLLGQGLESSAIAKELSIKSTQVDNFIKKSTTNAVIETTSGPVVPKISSKSLMINESAARNKNVSIMTGEASAFNDSLRQNNTARKAANSAIFRPSENK